MLYASQKKYILYRWKVSILTSILLCKTSSLCCIGASQFNCSNNHADRQLERVHDQHQSHYVPAATRREKMIQKKTSYTVSISQRCHKMSSTLNQMAIVNANGNERKSPSMVLVLNVRNEAKTSYETISPRELCCLFNPFFFSSFCSFDIVRLLVMW